MLSLFVFAGSVLAATHVLLAYPLILRVLVKYRAKPIIKGAGRPTVSVLIPVYNGAGFIREKLLSLLRQDYARERMEIIVVSDGSTDDTDEIVEEFRPDGVRLIQLPHGGKPATLNIGIQHARNEIILLTDVRQMLHSECISRLVRCFDDPSIAAVSGELVIRSGDTHEEVDIGLYWRFECWIRRQLSSLDSIFGATGPIYAMRRSLAVEVPPDILLDDLYLPLTAFFRGYRLVVEETARAFDYPTTLGTEFQRKVRTLAGNYQIICHMPQLLGPQNRMWFHFVSYKLGRLLLPYTLALAAISGLYLPGGWRFLLFSGQMAFLALAGLDFWIPQRLSIKRISSPARTFLVMMIAAVCAIRVFFVSPDQLWKESTIRPRTVAEEVSKRVG